MAEKFNLKAAHASSFNSYARIMNEAKICGCFYCGRIFSKKKIEEWADDGNGTPICPYCGIDSVLDDASGFPITRSFLNKMCKKYFGEKLPETNNDSNQKNYSISVNMAALKAYLLKRGIDEEGYEKYAPEKWDEWVEQMLQAGEPGVTIEYT